MNDSDAILTVPEVAKDLRLSRASVYKLINGQVPGVPAMPAILVGRRRLVRRSSLERWKQGNEQAAGAKMAAAHFIEAVDA
jgi:excisionase family DNA binding protein